MNYYDPKMLSSLPCTILHRAGGARADNLCNCQIAFRPETVNEPGGSQSSAKGALYSL
jgi:hypothetical protein